MQFACIIRPKAVVLFRNCQKIDYTYSDGFLSECKEAKVAHTEVCKAFADDAIWQKDKEEVQVIF